MVNTAVSSEDRRAFEKAGTTIAASMTTIVVLVRVKAFEKRGHAFKKQLTDAVQKMKVFLRATWNENSCA